jgi:hypothetical protein
MCTVAHVASSVYCISQATKDLFSEMQPRKGGYVANQCCRSGSGIRCLFDPWTRIRDRFFPDPGYQIPDSKPIFVEVSDKFLSKKFYNSLKTVLNFFFSIFKSKIILNFVKFAATKTIWQQIFFSPLSFVAVVGSRIRDPGWVKIRIRDPE